MSRILIAGSRHLRDTPEVRHLVTNALASAVETVDDEPVLVSGGQVSTDPRTGEKYGADHVCEQVWTSAEWQWPRGSGEWRRFGVEVHRADWDRYGRSAGPRRNRLMVGLGANIMVAFPIGESRGTRDCVRRAESAGIPTRVYEMTPEGPR